MARAVCSAAVASSTHRQSHVATVVRRTVRSFPLPPANRSKSSDLHPAARGNTPSAPLAASNHMGLATNCSRDSDVAPSAAAHTASTSVGVATGRSIPATISCRQSTVGPDPSAAVSCPTLAAGSASHAAGSIDVPMATADSPCSRAVTRPCGATWSGYTADSSPANCSSCATVNASCRGGSTGSAGTSGGDGGSYMKTCLSTRNESPWSTSSWRTFCSLSMACCSNATSCFTEATSAEKRMSAHLSMWLHSCSARAHS
mmetsp:Transcript_393/g.1097  ORF Transcript_393/g.1097 Transcript_393/m.1097 type:complete len:259 (-) Transcript_393:1612-2388(-)